MFSVGKIVDMNTDPKSDWDYKVFELVLVGGLLSQTGGVAFR